MYPTFESNPDTFINDNSTSQVDATEQPTTPNIRVDHSNFASNIQATQLPTLPGL